MELRIASIINRAADGERCGQEIAPQHLIEYIPSHLAIYREGSGSRHLSRRQINQRRILPDVSEEKRQAFPPKVSGGECIQRKLELRRDSTTPLNKGG